MSIASTGNIDRIETWQELKQTAETIGVTFEELVSAIQNQDYIDRREDLPLRLAKSDLREQAERMSVQQARYTVDMYYQIQRYRIQADAQRTAALKQDEPHEVLAFTALEMRKLEDDLRIALGAYADSQILGLWARSICGIGPVISAGLLAHIDIERAPTVGHIWAFAGFDPTRTWGKGEKRPWNAKLKTLCAYKLGESFVKVQNNKNDIYGQVYRARKNLEEMRNDQLLFKDQAAIALSSKKFGKETDAYKAYIVGRLPQARIHRRAVRYAVKLFLAHYHAVAYELHFGEAAPMPYILAQDNAHTHFYGPPHWNSTTREIDLSIKPVINVR